MGQQKVIKFSSPYYDDFGHKNDGIIGQTPGKNGIWGEYKFEINNDCSECDYWIIYETVAKKQHVKVPPGHTILVTSEEVLQKSYNQSYLKQFDRIITSRSDIQGPHVIHSYYINAWFVRRTYDQLKAETEIKKTKDLSVIASDLVRLDGHRKRYAFVNQLIGHFKDKIDVFGRGFNFIDDKYDALAPYKYSVAIENAEIEDYWTEKLADNYLTYTVPIYHGCPNIHDYFSKESLAVINVNDPRRSIETIEKLIEEDFYSKAYPELVKAKEKVLDELQFFPYISKLLDQHSDMFNMHQKMRQKVIVPIDHYSKKSEFKTKSHESLITGKNYVKSVVENWVGPNEQKIKTTISQLPVRPFKIKPSFIILGAQKAATTSLYYYLLNHPAIVPPKNKEINYFNFFYYYEQGENWYHNQFNQYTNIFGQRKTFEATPEYLYVPYAAKRIYDYNKDLKFIVILRDPVSRAYSSWNMFKKLHSLNKPRSVIEKSYRQNIPNNLKKILFAEKYPSFEEVIDLEFQYIRENNTLLEPSFIRRGHYAEQLERYFYLFEKKQFMIIEYQDFRQNTDNWLRKITRYIDLQDFNWTILNKEWTNRGNYEQEIKPETKEFLQDYYRPYNEKLFKLLNWENQWQ